MLAQQALNYNISLSSENENKTMSIVSDYSNKLAVGRVFQFQY
jgi:hypothetical protein